MAILLFNCNPIVTYLLMDLRITIRKMFGIDRQGYADAERTCIIIGEKPKEEDDVYNNYSVSKLNLGYKIDLMRPLFVPIMFILFCFVEYFMLCYKIQLLTTT